MNLSKKTKKAHELMYFISFKVNGEMNFSGKRRNLIETFRSDMNENCKGYHQDPHDL